MSECDEFIEQFSKKSESLQNSSSASSADIADTATSNANESIISRASCCELNNDFSLKINSLSQSDTDVITSFHENMDESQIESNSPLITPYGQSMLPMTSEDQRDIEPDMKQCDENTLEKFIEEKENFSKVLLLNYFNDTTSDIDSVIQNLRLNFQKCDNPSSCVHTFSLILCEILHEKWIKSGIENARDCPLLEQIIEKAAKLFEIFVSKRDDLEMQCLIAVHEFVQGLQYPSGLLLRIFELLYDFRLISFDSFIRWQNVNIGPDRLQISGGLKPLCKFFLNIEVSKKLAGCVQKDERNEVTNALNDIKPNEDVWKPNRMLSKLPSSDEDVEKTTELFRNITSVLNKLTPQNFDKLFETTKNLPIDTTTEIQIFVDIIHKKAIREWKFCSLYAKLCSLIQDVKVVDEKGDTILFSKLLINKCEKYFENSLSEDSKFLRRKAHINSLLNKATRKKFFQKYELDEYIFRKESVGNIRFIGELFKLFMITPKTIFKILDRLVMNGKNMAIECLCTMISTLGQFYEDKFGKLPGSYFEKIEGLSQQENLPLRLRFLLLDVIDLKNNSWRPRFKIELPKTFQEIELELQEQNKVVQSASANPPVKRNIGCLQSSTKLDEVASSHENLTHNSTLPAKKWIRIEELRKMCQYQFKLYVEHEKIESIADVIRTEVLSNQIPKLIFTLIEHVIQNDSANSEKCGKMLVSLLSKGVISTKDVVKGLSSLIKNSEQIPSDLEQVLGPLFFEDYLKLDDLNIVFENIRQKKPAKAATLKKKVDEIAISNENVDDNLCNKAKNVESCGKVCNPQDKIANKKDHKNENKGIVAVEKKSSGFPRSVDETSISNENESREQYKEKCLQTSSMLEHLSPSNFELENDKNVDLKCSNETLTSSPRSFKLIHDLLTGLTPEMYRRHKYRSKLQTLPFKRVDQLEYAASCIIEMVYDFPDLYEFYAEVCVNMKSLAVGRSLFWSILANECKNHFDKMINNETKPSEIAEPMKSSTGNATTTCKKQNIQLNNFCRFIAELNKQKLINDFDFKMYIERLLYSDPECFCDLYEHVEWKNCFSDLNLNLHIPQVLVKCNVNEVVHGRLQKILESWLKTVKGGVTYEDHLLVLNEVKKLQELEKRNSEELEKQAKELAQIKDLLKGLNKL